jgi:hypothetical protein
MAQYYYFTSEPLNFNLDRDKDGKIDWVKCGFDVKEIQRAVQGGFQGWLTNEINVSVFPIANMANFDKELGPIIARPSTDEVFNKKITEAEALIIKSTLKAHPDPVE